MKIANTLRRLLGLHTATSSEPFITVFPPPCWKREALRKVAGRIHLVARTEREWNPRYRYAMDLLEPYTDYVYWYALPCPGWEPKTWLEHTRVCKAGTPLAAYVKRLKLLLLEGGMPQDKVDEVVRYVEGTRERKAAAHAAIERMQRKFKEYPTSWHWSADLRGAESKP